MKRRSIITTTEEFIQRAKERHKDEYDYSPTKFLGATENLVIRCYIHGLFFQLPNNHIQGRGCIQCGRLKRADKVRIFTIEEFIKQAKNIHQDLYDYSLVKLDNPNNVEIKCSEHGLFIQSIYTHLRGSGCQKCGNIRRNKKNALTQKEFLDKAYQVHGNIYGYFYSVYTSEKNNVDIECFIHGRFLQSAAAHMNGQGCPKCGNERNGNRCRKTLETFIMQARVVHQDLYGYTKSFYIDSATDICITCQIHGDYWQTPNSHLRGGGCRKCADEYTASLRWISNEKFIERAIKIHGDLYDYSQIDCKSYKHKVIIGCFEHGRFEQSQGNHLKGAGCPKCRGNISKIETKWLDYLHIPNKWRQVSIKINDRHFLLDALDPVNNIAYEFNGDFWHGNPAIYDPNNINKLTQRTYGELHEKMLKKEATLKAAGYKVVSIWEKDFREKLKELATSF
jgi:hypothetical protein